MYRAERGMTKGIIVQNFLQFIWVTLVMVLLTTLYLVGSEEKNTQTISRVNSDLIKGQIDKIETRDLKDEEKKKLVDLYNVSLANIEKAKLYDADRDSFKQTRETATTEIENLRSVISERESILPQEMLNSLEMMTMLELVEAQDKEKADLSAVEAKLSAINNNIVVQNSRPNLVKERLIELKREVDDATTSVKASLLEGNVDLMMQAEAWVEETRTMAHNSEIKMLDQ